MMIVANALNTMRFVLYHQTYTCVTQLDSLVVIKLDRVLKTRVEHWCGELLLWASSLHTWGKAG